MERSFKNLSRSPGAVLCRPQDPEVLAKRLSETALYFPISHLRLLALANGVKVFNGYFRLFGVGCADCVDLISWNDFDRWKFAWNQDLSRYVCFGETAWGDQYAYDRETHGDEVYFLDAIRMKPERIASSFQEFIENEFVRCATSPYDDILVEASKALGRLAWTEHITYMPSLLLGGEETVDHVIKMDAYAAMIANGDLYAQCANESVGGEMATLESYIDSKGRGRIRVNWSP